MRRREFITLLGGAIAVPLATHAQEKVRRVGVLMNVASDDPEAQQCVAAFQQGLQALGWIVGRNLRIDQRWALGEVTRYRQAAVELVALEPDVVLVAGAGVLAVRQANPNMPVVFPQAIDPVGAGLVDSLARPGGNATGFLSFEYSIAGNGWSCSNKSPRRVTRVAVLRDATQGSGTSQFAVIQAMAPSLRMEINPVNMSDPGDIERAVVAFARTSNSGLIATVGGSAAAHRELTLWAARP